MTLEFTCELKEVLCFAFEICDHRRGRVHEDFSNITKRVQRNNRYGSRY
jgi:hypothetical protein